MRVVDEAFPADGGARLFEVDTHDNQGSVGDLFTERGEAAGVVERGFRIVDRAGAGDDQQARVASVEHRADGGAAFHVSLLCGC